jgi:hypothetical protein
MPALDDFAMGISGENAGQAHMLHFRLIGR